MCMYFIQPFTSHPLSKVRSGEGKMRSKRGVCLRQGRALGTNSLISPKGGAKKCGPNGLCALDTGVPWTRGGVQGQMLISPQLSFVIFVFFLRKRQNSMKKFNALSSQSDGSGVITAILAVAQRQRSGSVVQSLLSAYFSKVSEVCLHVMRSSCLFFLSVA